ncbi:MAG: hypothetical protein AAF539_04840 [Planctomycetota bacterium]
MIPQESFLVYQQTLKLQTVHYLLPHHARQTVLNAHNQRAITLAWSEFETVA